ncbi:hypothetical protein CC1G_12883 [Coprinopsis cinerea okayama7|uniref:Uncharacterized protein n=1 Tax=Coprinopsis cinerea (strain Okayama-7 / 130 / ATCC MYA-4618 / FGSC 9003) TaxID=240176 RepID=A8P2W1_COPC7|nr:hypothetical protein CC1G_12883 [Coprinopsis cinerea okayama7\|eukprot:XP_001838412.2 hypothetical protein CC1G_12883 [Coprinopsis cinerea okayama7\
MAFSLWEGLFPEHRSTFLGAGYLRKRRIKLKNAYLEYKFGSARNTKPCRRWREVLRDIEGHREKLLAAEMWGLIDQKKIPRNPKAEVNWFDYLDPKAGPPPFTTLEQYHIPLKYRDVAHISKAAAYYH